MNGSRALWLVVSFALSFVAGCNSSGGDQPSHDYVGKPEATYAGLAGKHCAVMIWADWRTRTEYNQIQLDTGRLLTGKLEQLLAPKEKDKEKKKDATETAPPATFLNPASVVRFQREHPDIAGIPITAVAPRLGVDRVIYVEFESFETQSPEAILLLKGSAKATLRVVEVDGSLAHVAFEEAGITAHYPPDAPEGVVASDKVNIRSIYEGTLDLLTDKLAVRFAVEKK